MGSAGYEVGIVVTYNSSYAGIYETIFVGISIIPCKFASLTVTKVQDEQAVDI
jgi:hypothetical protein